MTIAKPAFPERHPYLFVGLVELLIIGVYLAAGTADHFFQFGGLGVYAVANAALTIALAGLITALGWWRRVGFRRVGRREWLWLLPMCLPVLLNFYPGLAPGGVVAVAGFVVLALMVGFVEEAAFRGLMLRALERVGTARAVAITTVLFSLTHLMNMMAGEGALQAVLQLCYSAAIGFAFTAYALRTGAIWPLIIVHALIDLVAFLQDGAVAVPPAVETTLAAVVTVWFVAWGWYLMSRRPDATEAGQPVVAAASNRP